MGKIIYNQTKYLFDNGKLLNELKCIFNPLNLKLHILFFFFCQTEAHFFLKKTMDSLNSFNYE